MSKGIRIADDLSLPLDAVTMTFGVLAVRGAGKSNTAAVMAEQMWDAKLPFVVIDPVGAWYGLRSSADGSGPGLAIPIFGGRHGDVPLEKTAGQLIADLVVDERLSCVLDVSEFSEGDKIRFLIDFAERLYRRNTEPLHLFLEEADDYAPQRPMREQARLLRAFENVVRRGRARGLGITMITQRSAALNKNVLTQIETLIVLRTTSPQDRKAIEAWVEYHGQAHELLESLPGLGNGEAWVWSPFWLKQLKRVQIRRRTTFDSGATPKNVHGSRPAATIADVDLGAIQKKMAASIERMRSEDPKELRRRIAELEGQLYRVKPQKAEVVEKRVEVPVLKDVEIKRLEKAAERLEKHATFVRESCGYVDQSVKQLREDLRAAVARPVERSSPRPVSIFIPRVRQEGKSALPSGERKVLTAIAQHGVVTREQLTILTGFKRSTRDAYLQRLREKGLIAVNGDGISSLPGVVNVLGDFEPLPTGDALREYWVGRLPDGERRVLEVAVKSYPNWVAKDEVSRQLEYARSSRDAYVQRLKARRLVVVDRGSIRASEMLFG